MTAVKVSAVSSFSGSSWMYQSWFQTFLYYSWTYTFYTIFGFISWIAVTFPARQPQLVVTVMFVKYVRTLVVCLLLSSFWGTYYLNIYFPKYRKVGTQNLVYKKCRRALYLSLRSGIMNLLESDFAIILKIMYSNIY